MHRLELNVQQRNLRAVHFYEKVGFEREGIKRHSLRIGDDYLDEWLTAKLIGPYRIGAAGGCELAGAPAAASLLAHVPRATLAARRGQAQSAPCHLIAHDLHAAVIDPRLERAHHVVRE